MDYDTLGYGCMGWAIGLCIANGWHMVYPTNGQMRHKLTHQSECKADSPRQTQYDLSFQLGITLLSHTNAFAMHTVLQLSNS